MTEDDRNRYMWMENHLQTINKRHIALPPEEVRENNQILNEILDSLILKMKAKDPLFKSMYRELYYGGSYYDGLRVAHPEEFDVDLLFALPKYAEPVLTISNLPGYVSVQFKALDKYLKQPEAKTFVNIQNLLDEKHYIITSCVSSWMERVVNRALNEFPKSGNSSEFYTSRGTFMGKLHKGGPALTLKLTGNINGRCIVIDIDLVPCFVFTKDKWPPTPYRRPSGYNQEEFFIVPKKPSSPQGIIGRYWRLSFQEQERALMNNLRNFKPALKLLKKLRDKENFAVISSYYIKTVFLWENETNRSLFTDYSLNYVFIYMLNKLRDRIQQKNIPYFWNKNFNLLENVKSATLENISNRLGYIITDITEKHANDSTYIEKYLGSFTSTSNNEITEIEDISPEPSETDNSSWCTIL